MKRKNFYERRSPSLRKKRKSLTGVKDRIWLINRRSVPSVPGPSKIRTKRVRFSVVPKTTKKLVPEQQKMVPPINLPGGNTMAETIINSKERTKSDGDSIGFQKAQTENFYRQQPSQRGRSELDDFKKVGSNLKKVGNTTSNLRSRAQSEMTPREEHCGKPIITPRTDSKKATIPQSARIHVQNENVAAVQPSKVAVVQSSKIIENTPKIISQRAGSEAPKRKYTLQHPANSRSLSRTLGRRATIAGGHDQSTDTNSDSSSCDPEMTSYLNLYNTVIASNDIDETIDSYNELIERSKQLREEKNPQLCGENNDVDFPFKLLENSSGGKGTWVLEQFKKRFKNTIDHWKVEPKRKVQVVIIGMGPVGLRTAIAARMCGHKVKIVEKRKKFERINRLHLWDFVKIDLIKLNAKNYRCDGNDFSSKTDYTHIGINEIQMILLKSALFLGVEPIFERTFNEAKDNPNGGWELELQKSDGSKEHIDAEVLIIANGSRSKDAQYVDEPVDVEFRTATGVIANFKVTDNVNNKKDELRQFSFAKQFYQEKFKNIYDVTGVDLENIVYYKGTHNHYFIMTVTMKSLIDKEIYDVNKERVPNYQGNLKKLTLDVVKLMGLHESEQFFCDEFACMTFDFSTQTRCPTTVKFHNKINNKETAMACLVGDALMEPFWPEGLGCIRGFLSGFDAVSNINTWLESGAEAAKDNASNSYKQLKLLCAQSRDSIVKTKEEEYKIDPRTRYINF